MKRNLAAFAAHGAPSMPFPEEGDHAEPDGDEGAGVGAGGRDGDEEGDVEVAARVGAAVEAGEVDEDLVALMADFDAGEEEEIAPPWVGDADLWVRAVAAVDPMNEGNERWRDPWLVVAHVYREIGGGTIASGEDEDEEEVEEEPPGDLDGEPE